MIAASVPATERVHTNTRTTSAVPAMTEISRPTIRVSPKIPSHWARKIVNSAARS